MALINRIILRGNDAPELNVLVGNSLIVDSEHSSTLWLCEISQVQIPAGRNVHVLWDLLITSHSFTLTTVFITPHNLGCLERTTRQGGTT